MIFYQNDIIDFLGCFANNKVLYTFIIKKDDSINIYEKCKIVFTSSETSRLFYSITCTPAVISAQSSHLGGTPTDFRPACKALLCNKNSSN
jgi:hypothetical protein